MAFLMGYTLRCQQTWRSLGHQGRKWRFRSLGESYHPYLVAHPTARKWVITKVINGISRVNPLRSGVN